MLHRDEYRIIGQIQLDGSIEGGDSACWMGHYIYLTDDKFPFAKTFEVAPGAYVRHFDYKKTNKGFGAYYKDHWNGCISRDQMTGILLGLLKQKDKKAIFRLIKHHSKRFFLFAYNTIKNGEDPKTAKWKMPDLTMLDIWALEIRGLGKLSWLCLPILCVLDLQMLISALLDRIFKSKDPDVINFIGKLLASKEYTPTPISWLTSKIVDKKDLKNKLRTYWCGWRDNSDFLPLFEKKMDEVL